MSTDKQRALDALAVLAQHGPPGDKQHAFDALSQHGPPIPSTDIQPRERILADIDALLVLIDHQANKVALALKPPNPAYDPAVPVLEELTQHISKLVYAAYLLRDDVHGATLARHVKRHVSQVSDALRDLAQSFITDGDEHYLVKAGTLHDVIETARGPSGIPKDNQAAVYLSWRSDSDLLEDSLEEVAQIVVQEAESRPTSNVDEDWNEIGLAHTANLDQLEAFRANKVHQILRLTTLFHQRIFIDILSYPSLAPLSAFDALALLSDKLVATSDELVAALDSPQDLDQIHEETLQLADVVNRIHIQLAVFLPATDQLTQQLLAISLKDTAPTSSMYKKRPDKKWFYICVEQIVGLCSKLTEEKPAE